MVKMKIFISLKVDVERNFNDWVIEMHRLNKNIFIKHLTQSINPNSSNLYITVLYTTQKP